MSDVEGESEGEVPQAMHDRTILGRAESAAAGVAPNWAGRDDEQRATPSGTQRQRELCGSSAVWQTEGNKNPPNTPAISPFASTATAAAATPAAIDPLDASTLARLSSLHRENSISSSLYQLKGDVDSERETTRASDRQTKENTDRANQASVACNTDDEDWSELEDELDGAREEEAKKLFSEPYFGNQHKVKSYQCNDEFRSVKDAKGKGKRKQEPHVQQPAASEAGPSKTMATDNDVHGEDWQQAGQHADAQDLAGPGMYGRLECTVSKPQKENEGTQNQYISYLVTTETDFKSFQSSHINVRRRFTDFVFLYKTLSREYPQCAVPPIPDKHKMEYVRGDRFGPDFTQRRAHSLERFLKRLSLHPVLRRAALFILFLESTDWNATMKSRPSRGMSGSEGNTSVLETWTDSFLNAFTRPHKQDQRFIEVRERSDKLEDDLGIVSKTVSRVARRESDLKTDYAELATQFQKLAQLEPGVQNEMTAFAASLEATGQGWKTLSDHTDQDYLTSLRDMEAYSGQMKSLLKTREQKQLDFEGLTEYQNKAANERDNLASNANLGASGYIRHKIEDVRGVDHDAVKREKVRKLEVQIRRLNDEVDGAKKTSEAFDEEVVKEVADFERIKAEEFRDTLGGLADANMAFFANEVDVWEKFLRDMGEDKKDDGEGEQ